METDYLPDHLGAEYHKHLMEKLENAVKDFKNLELEEEEYFLEVVGEGQAEPGLLGPGKGKEGSGTRVAGCRDERAGGRVFWVWLQI